MAVNDQELVFIYGLSFFFFSINFSIYFFPSQLPACRTLANAKEGVMARVGVGGWMRKENENGKDEKIRDGV